MGLCVGTFNLCEWHCIADLVSFPDSALCLRHYPRGHANTEPLLLTSAQGSALESTAFYLIFKKEISWSRIMF